MAHRCRGSSTESGRLQRALVFFYQEKGFAGNAQDYYNPDNSYLHKVLQTRRGIPITLAVLFSELVRTNIRFDVLFLVQAHEAAHTHASSRLRWSEVSVVFKSNIATIAENVQTTY